MSDYELTLWQEALSNEICLLSKPCIDGLSVYRNNYFYGHLNALIDNFPRTQNLLGQNHFKAIAGGYCLAEGALEPELNTYGRHFDQYLKRELAHYLCNREASESVDYQQVINTAKTEINTLVNYYGNFE